MQTVQHTWLNFISIYHKWESSMTCDRWRHPVQHFWWIEQLMHCSQQKLLHLSSLSCGTRCGMIIHLVFTFFSKAEGWIDWSMLAKHLTQKLGCSSHLLSATIIQMTTSLLLPNTFWSTGCLCHSGFIIDTLAKPLSSSIAIGSLLKKAFWGGHICMFFFMTMDRAWVIAWTIKLMNG